MHSEARAADPGVFRMDADDSVDGAASPAKSEVHLEDREGHHGETRATLAMRGSVQQ